MKRKRLSFILPFVLVALTCTACLADDAPPAADGSPAEAAPAPEAPATATKLDLDIVWTCIAAFMVFFMQAGFAMVESGFTRAKNAVNILMKNLMDFSVGTVAFLFVGFSLMFGESNGFCGNERWAEIARKDQTGPYLEEMLGCSIGKVGNRSNRSHRSYSPISLIGPISPIPLP